MEVLSLDSQFLKKHNLMDYSLYLAVEQVNPDMVRAMSQKERSASRNIIFSRDLKEAYHIGVIDYLQKWDGSKIRENWWKTRIMLKDRTLLSAVEPNLYQKRWIEFMRKIIVNTPTIEMSGTEKVNDLDDIVSQSIFIEMMLSN